MVFLIAASVGILAFCFYVDIQGRIASVALATLTSLHYLFFYAICPKIAGVIVPDMVVPRTMRPSTIALILAGQILFLAGWYLAQGRNRSGRTIVWSPDVSGAEHLAGWGALLGSLSFNLVPVLNRMPSISQMQQPLLLAGLSILVWAALHRRMGRWEGAAFVLCILFKVGAQLEAGFISPIIMEMMVITAILLFTRRWRILSGIAVVTVLLMLSYVPIKFVSNQVRHADTFSAATDITQYHFGLARSIELVVRRSAHGLLLEKVTELTPETVPYWNGSTLANLLWNNVPRLLWPNKPEERLGNRFGHVYGLLNDGDQGTSWNVPWLVEFYMNFGYGGALICMAAAGLVIGGLTRLLDGDHLTVRRIALISATTLPLFHPDSNVSLLAGNLLWVIVLLLVVFVVADRLWAVAVRLKSSSA